MKSVYLNVKVAAGSRKTELKGKMADGTLKISVAAPPEKGKANIALIKFLASHFKIAQKNISIQKGAASRNKLIRIIYD